MRFVLVHGGFHGAWCWDPLVLELRAAGHDAVAVDLPGHGERASERSTLDGYQQAVVDATTEGDVLVGHSMGGYVTSIAADVVGPMLRHLIYLAAGVPVEGEAMGATQSEDKAGISEHYVVEDGPHGVQILFTSYEGARRHFYHDCDEGVARRAFERLTPQQIEPTMAPISMDAFWSLGFPRSMIVCLDDRSGINYYMEGFLRRLALRQAYAFLSSHSPFLSRPAELAELLVAVANSEVGRHLVD